ncbi:MAG: UbiA family prenyltransferase [Roseobacter sp.]|jgi:4-hydroxybenzoate polyprenyltransferase|nr:UbiA family prenyltransferase [Roseobacter sp.]
MRDANTASNQPFPGVLVVDLDGTLLRSDMLFESFWSAFARDWRMPVKAVAALSQGRAVLKRQLAEASAVDVANLPYNAEVLSYIDVWRRSGRRVVLVTATDQALADRIAEHLDIFDEVYGSDGSANLKGARKAAFLVEQYGDKAFAYMGDSSADVPVWEHAAQAITVNASGNLRQEAERASGNAEHLGSAKRAIGSYLKAIRPHQWMKNALVFLPILAAHQFAGTTVLQGLMAFIAFSLIASSVYVVNDMLDLAADRAHPRKRLRPFAAGSIPIAHGIWMTAGLIGAGTLIAIALGWQFLLVMIVYYALTTAYSLNLKRRTIIDICTLAGLYTIRIVAGAAATGIELSVWLLAFSIFFFFSLASVKRQAELIDNLKRGQLSATGRGYHVDDLPVITMMAIASGYVSVMIMALYVNSPGVTKLYSQPVALWGICCILLYWLSRTILLAHRGHMHDDPVVYAAKDRISQVCGFLIFAFGLGGVLL